MEFDVPLYLDGDEFLTTYFIKEEESVMILALGDNTNFERKGAATVFLYLCIDGEVEHGIDTFVFFERSELQEFLEKLPQMNIFDFVLRGSGIQPNLHG